MVGIDNLTLLLSRRVPQQGERRLKLKLLEHFKSTVHDLMEKKESTFPGKFMLPNRHAELASGPVRSNRLIVILNPCPELFKGCLFA